MYLTAGQYKGHKIEVPKSAKPTLSKTRQAVFNMLCGFEFKNNSFLDMFSGSGIMGLEAISRGYNVIGLETNSKTIQIIKKNYEKLKLTPNIILCDALKYKGEKFDIVYIDPPWKENYEPIINAAYDLLNDEGVIIIEYDAQNNLDIKDIIKRLKLNPELHKKKKYGRTLIDLLSFVK